MPLTCPLGILLPPHAVVQPGTFWTSYLQGPFRSTCFSGYLPPFLNAKGTFQCSWAILAGWNGPRCPGTLCFSVGLCCLIGAELWLAFGSVFELWGRRRCMLHSVLPQHVAYATSSFNFTKYLGFWSSKSSNSLLHVISRIPWSNDNRLA